MNIPQPWHSSGNLPVMDKMCKTCPFGPNDQLGVRETLVETLMQTQRVCHQASVTWDENTPIFSNLPGTHICRGALTKQAQIMHSVGYLPAPTVQAWEDMRAERGMPERKPCDCAQCRLAETVRANRSMLRLGRRG